jgi:5-methylcytosine-specific restriction endonuclease McrA
MDHSTAIPKGYKKCSQGENCIHPDGPILPRTEEYFYMSKGHASARCRPCQLAYRKAHHERNREHDNARSLEYVRRNKEKVYADNRRWLKENRDRVRVYQLRRYHLNANGDRDKRLAYYQANRVRLLEQNRQWSKENMEQRRVITSRFRMKKYGNRGEFTAEELKIVYNQQAGRCWYCSQEVGDTWHTDHRVPLSRGGSNEIGNIVITCPQCNLSKGRKLPHEWNGRLL